MPNRPPPPKDRSNKSDDREAIPSLTETQRKIVKVAKDEAIKAVETKYDLPTLIPFVKAQKTEQDTSNLIWKKVTELVGIERKDRVKIVLLIFLIALFSAIIGPTSVFDHILKFFGG